MLAILLGDLVELELCYESQSVRVRKPPCKNYWLYYYSNIVPMDEHKYRNNETLQPDVLGLRSFDLDTTISAGFALDNSCFQVCIPFHNRKEHW